MMINTTSILDGTTLALKPQPSHGMGILFCLSVLVLWTSGCAHVSHADAFARNGAVTLLPQLTAVATGPSASLLANGQTCHGDYTLALAGDTKPVLLTGQIYARDGKLCFTTIIGNHKTRATGGFSVIWDPAARQGFVSCEALQGYAPLYVAVRSTLTQTQVQGGQTDRQDGHPVDQANATFQSSDGQSIVLQLSRALDLGNLPLQIHSLSGPPAFTLSLANLQSGAPSADMFSPPDGFTKYASEQVLLDELAERQHLVYTPDEEENLGQPGTGTHRVNDEPGNR